MAENGPHGERRAVFVLEPHAPHGWELGLRIVLACADVVLIAALF